jgi:hypothetical protein
MACSRPCAGFRLFARVLAASNKPEPVQAEALLDMLTLSVTIEPDGA